MRISGEFDTLWDMPRVIGAIDGKHMTMDCPKCSGSLLYNYKRFFSLVLLAVCDAGYTFTVVDVGQYGSNNDSGVLLNSEIGQRFEDDSFEIPCAEKLQGCTLEKLPYYLVGDNIFPLKNWLMHPYPGKLSEEQRIYNYRLSRACRVIENTFGILVARWRLFRGPIRAAKENEDSSGRIKPGEWRRIVESDNGCLQRIPKSRGSPYTVSATEMREALKNYVNSTTVSVPWQLNYNRSTGHKE
eukprot:gene12483-13766_t